MGFRKYLIYALMFVLLVSTISPNYTFAAKGEKEDRQTDKKATQQGGKKSYFVKLKNASSSDDFIKNKKGSTPKSVLALLA